MSIFYGRDWLPYQISVDLCLDKLVAGALAQLSPPKTSKFKCLRNGCCDEHEWCRFWASIGECEANPAWMKINCQLACNSCRAPGGAQETITVTTELLGE
uniref:ShKT domain-containing protein n=1 Tax=Ascaris lumbricoides TaxID=6252 RepID=A0A0M3IK56_ASCLU